MADARDVDVVDELRRVGRVVGDRLRADVVERLHEGRVGAFAVRHCLRRTRAAIAGDDGERVGLAQVRVRILVGVDAAHGEQRHRHGLLVALGPDLERRVLELVLEAELEGQVLDRVAVVVDVDLVERLGIHKEVVRAAIGRLERDVVGDHRDGVLAPGS
jgi:hypothetical protein